MSEKLPVKVLIHTDTAIKGVPVTAGETVEVDEETAARLAGRGYVVERDGKAVELPQEAAENHPDLVSQADPEAAHREPRSRSHKRSE